MHPSLRRAIDQRRAVHEMRKARKGEDSASALYPAVRGLDAEVYKIQKLLNAEMDPVEVLYE